MIDCKYEVYSRISEVLKDKFPTVNLSSEYVNAPSSFPYISITQSDNSIIPDQTTGTSEMAQVMFEVNAYSNKTSEKKIECEEIVKLIDNIFFSMNFRRMTMTTVPNMEDATIHRIVARYRAATDGKNFYRR